MMEEAHFDGDSFRLNDCLAAPVHMIPDEAAVNYECDFYLQTKYDVYLLRLTNSAEKMGTLCPAGKGGIIYIACCLPISKATITESVQTILHSLERYGFPNLYNPKHEITFAIE